MSTAEFSTARERFMWALANASREAFDDRRLEFRASLDHLETLRRESPIEYDHTPDTFMAVPIVVIPGLGHFSLHEQTRRP